MVGLPLHMRDVAHRPMPPVKRARNVRREELARDLLLKLLEADPRAVAHNVRAAVEYTDALLAELEKGEKR